MRDRDTIARRQMRGVAQTEEERDRLRPWQTHGSRTTAQTVPADL